MSEYLRSEHREKIVETIEILCAYVCEFATDGDLFVLQGLLSNQAGQLAYPLASLGEGMLGPAPNEPRPPSESLNHRPM